jgi:hypothetical protein
MASTSGVGSIGVAGAQAARMRMPINAIMSNFDFILPLLFG